MEKTQEKIKVSLPKRRVWVEIDMAEVLSNFKKIASAVRPVKVLPVLKANAYGLGVMAYAQALLGENVAGFGVAEPYEALQLSGCGKTVQILSSVLPDEIESMIAAGVTLPVISMESARIISRTAVKMGMKAKVHFKIDSGMGRLGIPIADAENTVSAASVLPGLCGEGIFSHCPVAYDPENPFTARQISEMVRLVRALSKRGIRFKTVHIAASDAINNFPRAFRSPFNTVRTGINLHGSFDPNGRRILDLKSVLTLKTRVAQVRNLPAGTTIGYGRTWCLDRPSKIATISAGYADGLPMNLANRGHVLIGGKVCPVVGRISMDYTTVDASLCPGVKPGDEVVCLGTSGGHTVSPDDWALLKGTHAYDIICSFGNRVERVYLHAGKGDGGAGCRK